MSEIMEMSNEIVRLNKALDEAKKSAEYWKEEARRYCDNAQYWRRKASPEQFRNEPA